MTIEPYANYIYIEPVELKVAVGAPQLNCYAKVLAVGPDVLHTAVGEYVAFELWDKPEFQGQDEKIYHFVKESDVICKVTPDALHEQQM